MTTRFHEPPGWNACWRVAVTLVCFLCRVPTTTHANDGMRNILFELRSDIYESNDIGSSHKLWRSSMSRSLDKMANETRKSVAFNPEVESHLDEMVGQCGGEVVCAYKENTFHWDVPSLHESSNTYASPHVVLTLADDWGRNDLGLYSDWIRRTPHLDLLADEGIELTLHFLEWQCAPSRACLLTGRYTSRTGFWGTGAHTLGLNETTLAQELQSVGYRTHMIGKWHLGFESLAHWPTYRGFNHFYGFMNKESDYWSKTWMGYFDLQDHEELVTDPGEIGTHSGLLLARKAVEAIEAHDREFISSSSRAPLFLYYAPALVHTPFPDINPAPFSGRCGDIPAHVDTTRDLASYCELILMLDESVANISCALQRLGWADNTLMIVLSDNGGAKYTPGSTYPLRGAKGGLWNGGILGRAFIQGAMLPDSTRGCDFAGLSHLTDWLPTLMHLATNGAWNGKFNNDSHDGVNLWNSLIECTPNNTNRYSPRTEVFINFDMNTGEGALIRSGAGGDEVYKLLRISFDDIDEPYYTPEWFFGDERSMRKMCNMSRKGTDNPSAVPSVAPSAMPSLSPSRISTISTPSETSTSTTTDATRSSSSNNDNETFVVSLAVLAVVFIAALICCSRRHTQLKNRKRSHRDDPPQVSSMPAPSLHVAQPQLKKKTKISPFPPSPPSPPPPRLTAPS